MGILKAEEPRESPFPACPFGRVAVACKWKMIFVGFLVFTLSDNSFTFSDRLIFYHGFFAHSGLKFKLI